MPFSTPLKLSYFFFDNVGLIILVRDILGKSWHPASQGAILADLYFQLVDDMVEISWNNQDAEEGVIFTSEPGGVSVRREVFCNEVNSFLKEYSDHWFGNI